MITAHTIRRKKEFMKTRKSEAIGIFLQCCIGCLFLAANFMEIGVFSHMGANIGFVFVLKLIEALYLPAHGIQCGLPYSFVSEEELKYATIWRRMFVFTFFTWMFFGGITITAGLLDFALGTSDEKIYFWTTLGLCVLFFFGCMGSGFVVMKRDMRKYMPHWNEEVVMEDKGANQHEEGHSAARGTIGPIPDAELTQPN